MYLVSINSKDCVNFKTALNHIVKNLTEKGNNNYSDQAYDEEDDLRYDKRLRYDLDIIAEWCRRLVKNDPNLNTLGNLRVVISIDDADSFDVSILTSLIKMLHSYISYVPFKLILSVATSIEVFEEKLPRSSIRLLNGQSINACPSDGLLTILKSTIFRRIDPGFLLLGPKLFKSVIQRQQQSLESIDTYISSLKYAYMSHYYSNPFANIFQIIQNDENFSQDELLEKYFTKDHYKAIRLLGSFREMVERATFTEEDSLERYFLDNDHLRFLVISSIHEFSQYKKHMLYGFNLLMVMQNALIDKNKDQDISSISKYSILELYPNVITGEIKEMAFYEELKTAVSSCTPEILAVILFDIAHFADPPKFLELSDKIFLGEFKEEINLFIDTSNHEFDALPDGLDSREKVKRYAKLVKSITNLIFTELSETFVSYRSFLLHEAFVVDTANLQENVFVPTHRGAIEMALSNPKHYWGDVLTNTMTNELATDDDLDPNDMSAMGSDPHLCIMYTLYRESSVFINIYDWYTSFETILKKPEGDDPMWEKKVLSWFLQGVAELKFLGIIRDSKRKFECVEKLVWRGL